MDYYKRRSEAALFIENKLKTEESVFISDIIILIEKNYGLTKKFVFDVLENYEKSSLIEISGHTIKLVK